MSFSGQVALVTGAARGIGYAVAEALAKAGASLAVADIDEAGLQVAADKLRQHAANVWATKVDVSDTAAVQALIADVKRQAGRLDILVNNAGMMATGTLETCTEAEWDRVMAVNLKSTFFACQAAVPVMKEQGYGRIINMSSSAAKSVHSLSGIGYIASKAGIAAITRVIAHQYGPYGITCNAVAPGPIDTDMPRSSFPADVLARHAQAMPVRRLGTADEVARAVLFLASRDAGFITGEIMDVNGGAVID